ncbi:MAG: anaerobic sulfatase maturase [Candidatus Eisenbacteria bacterium]|nr:anaerobic sulfatase maturase [Candidatus Eisenbacteria bacterium]
MTAFSLLLKPASADCDLRCRYCFYRENPDTPADPSDRRMSDAILERVISSYLATDQPRHSFCWQGGEPTLMGEAFFRRATELQERHARPGAVIENSLQTNAAGVTDGLARHLAERRFLVGVSIDGPEDLHDRYRVDREGRGTRRAVLAGVERLRRAGAEPNALALVTRDGEGRAAEIYRELGRLGFRHHQYIPCVETDRSGRPLPWSVTAEGWGAFLSDLFDAWHAADTRRVSIRLFDSILNRMVLGVADVCAMDRACGGYFVVEANGDLYPCDFFVRDGLRLGNATRTTWEKALSSPIRLSFAARKREWNEACDRCEWLDLCAGDCLKHRPGDSRALSLLCAGWKRFFRHTEERFRGLASTLRREMHTDR